MRQFNFWEEQRQWECQSAYYKSCKAHKYMYLSWSNIFGCVSFAFVICVCKPHCLLGYHCPKGFCVYVCTPFSYLLREPDIGPLYDVTKLIPQHTPNYKWGMPASIKNLITFQAKRVNSAFCTLFHTYTHTHLAYSYKDWVRLPSSQEVCECIYQSVYVFMEIWCLFS